MWHVLVIGLIAAVGSSKDTIKAVGRVADENGMPIAGATIRVAVPAADMRLIYPGCGHRIVDGTTDANGRYELAVPMLGEKSVAVDAMKPGFQSASGPPMSMGDLHRGNVVSGATFEASFILKPGTYAAGAVVDEQLVSETIEDVYALPPAGRQQLTVKMKRGRSVSGIVLDASGKPVSEAVIEATFEDDHVNRKAVTSGADGHFSIVGLPEKTAVVRVQAFSIKQHAELSLILNRDWSDLEPRLESVVFTEPLDSIEFLGLKLATITPELRAAYFLRAEDQGVVVLDPGKNSARLGVGELQEGDFFWLVDSRRAKTVRRFVGIVLATCARQEDQAPPFVVPVVYGLKRLDFSGTNTQFMELTAEDVSQLKRVAAELSTRPIPASVLQETKNPHAALGVRPTDGSGGLAGVFISRVVGDSAADRAGIRSGDVITQVDDVSVKNSQQLIQAIRSKKPGEKVVIEILREVREERKKIRLPVILDEY